MFPWLKPYHTHKFQLKFVPCVFLGYSTTQSAYLCLHLPTQCLYVSQHVTFDEHVYPLKNITNQSISESSILVAPILSAPLLQIVTPANQAPSAPVSTAPQEELSLPTLNSDTITTVSPVQVTISAPVVSQRQHTMTTRSMNNIFVPKQLHTTTTHPLHESVEPTCISQALKNPLWRNAMSKEIIALFNHATWELVPPADSPNLIGCKFVFRTKRNSDGTISRYKARLVTKGFHQRLGLDYSQTFSPVVKPATIRLILSIAVMNGWSLRQLDINSAFLHGSLEETMFMHQPPGFKDTSKPDYVCKLKKRIYRLKQAPRQWYKALRDALLQFGFVHSATNTSLFIYAFNSVLCYCLVYIDDIIITGNAFTFIAGIINKLSHTFSIKDMGHLHFFFLALKLFLQPRASSFHNTSTYGIYSLKLPWIWPKTFALQCQPAPHLF